MARYECTVCGYVFDDDQEGLGWDALPDDWACPACGADKTLFNRLGDGATAANHDAPGLAVATATRTPCRLSERSTRGMPEYTEFSRQPTDSNRSR